MRSIRYPGIISWKTKPGGGTTDYAIDIYFKALKEGVYECFLSQETRLPMMYMNDAVAATIQLMQAKPADVKLRTGYNLAAIDFTPAEMALEIKKHLQDFKILYKPDFRQEIAASWPSSIDDSEARKDWNWKHQFDLAAITKEMLKNIKTESIV